MIEQGDLLGGEGLVLGVTNTAPQLVWRFLTNHLNMAYILGSGLIMPPTGFGGKHYQDSLDLVPGWIPLFAKDIAVQAVTYSIQEHRNLRPCFVELDLGLISSMAWVYRQGWQQIQFPEGLQGDEELLLLPAPLPISLIKEHIVFVDRKDQDHFKQSLSDYSNASLGELKLKTAKAEFNKKKTMAWPPPLPAVGGPKALDINLAAANAMGGSIAALVTCSYGNDAALRAYQWVAGRTEGTSSKYDKLFGFLNDWSQNPVDKQHETSLFARIVECIRKNSASTDYASTLDIVTANFVAISEELYPGNQASSEQLVKLLLDNAQSPQHRLVDLFDRNDKELQQILLGFVFRERLLELIENPLPTIAPERLAAIVLLLGLKQGWLDLENDVKQQQKMGVFVPMLMAQWAHRDNGTSLRFAPFSCPLLLREYFMTADWDKGQTKAALKLAQVKKWPCLSTRIRLGQGDYQLQVSRSGVDIVLDGVVQQVSTEVNQEEFMDQLRSLDRHGQVDVKLETELRSLLGEK